MEAHLAVKVEDEVNRDLRRDGCSPQPPHPHTRPHRVEAEKVSEQIFTLLELMSYRARWEPVYQLYCTAGCQNTREWGIRFPERSGLNSNLADRFRENKKFKVVFE